MSGDGEEIIEVDKSPTPQEEAENTFANQRDRWLKIQNNSDEQDIAERKRYADHAYHITQSWLGFLIVVTIAQFSLKPLKMGFTQTEFVAVVTTTTASMFGFWALVGRYLFSGTRAVTPPVASILSKSGLPDGQEPRSSR